MVELLDILSQWESRAKSLKATGSNWCSIATAVLIDLQFSRPDGTAFWAKVDICFFSHKHRDVSQSGLAAGWEAWYV